MAGARFTASAEGDLALDRELFDRENRKPSTVQRSFHRGVQKQRTRFFPCAALANLVRKQRLI